MIGAMAYKLNRISGLATECCVIVYSYKLVEICSLVYILIFMSNESRLYITDLHIILHFEPKTILAEQIHPILKVGAPYNIHIRKSHFRFP